MDDDRLVDALDELSNQLQTARDRSEPTGIISHFDQVETESGRRFFEVLVDESLPRDSRLRAYRLLDKCTRFDSDASFYIDPELVVSGVTVESYAIAEAVRARRGGKAVGVISIVPSYGPGIVEVADPQGLTDVVVVADDSSRVEFYRWSYRVEDVSEADFFVRAEFAFPRLRFADGVSFRRFDGTYEEVREMVLDHLAALSDEFRQVYMTCSGLSDEVSARLGVPISIEGSNTRGSEQLMKHRDAVLNGRTYRCEWHSKLEPHRNRIHLHPGDDVSEGCVVIGMFVDHLPT